MLKTIALAIMCIAAALAVGFTFAILATVGHAQQYSGGASYDRQGREYGRYQDGSSHPRTSNGREAWWRNRALEQGDRRGRGWSRPDAYPYRGGTWRSR